MPFPHFTAIPLLSTVMHAPLLIFNPSADATSPSEGALPFWRPFTPTPLASTAIPLYALTQTEPLLASIPFPHFTAIPLLSTVMHAPLLIFNPSVDATSPSEGELPLWRTLTPTPLASTAIPLYALTDNLPLLSASESGARDNPPPMLLFV